MEKAEEELVGGEARLGRQGPEFGGAAGGGTGEDFVRGGEPRRAGAPRSAHDQQQERPHDSTKGARQEPGPAGREGRAAGWKVCGGGPHAHQGRMGRRGPALARQLGDRGDGFAAEVHKPCGGVPHDGHG